MRTNKTMVRKMGSFDVQQRTKDGMFNVSYLIEQWNKVSKVRKRIDKFLQIEETQQFIQVLRNDLYNAENNQLSDNQVRDLSTIPHNQAVKVLGIIDKTNAQTTKKGRRIAGEVWVHPYLFIDFAMWINPRFKLQVVKFVYDQLIEFRHNAGDYYKGLTSAISGFEGVDYVKVAKGLNYIIFDKHEPELRQNATQAQLRALSNLQQQLAFAVNMGYIRSFNELLNEMRRIYNMRKKYFNI